MELDIEQNKNEKDIIQKLVGRPTILKEPVVKKLEDALRGGANISEACKYAGISRQVFYSNIAEKDTFLYRMTSARDYLKLRAMSVIKERIDSGDLKASMWYLEKWSVIESRDKEIEELEIKNARETKENYLDIDEIEKKAQMMFEAVDIIKRRGKFAPVTHEKSSDISIS